MKKILCSLALTLTFAYTHAQQFIGHNYTSAFLIDSSFRKTATIYTDNWNRPLTALRSYDRNNFVLHPNGKFYGTAIGNYSYSFTQTFFFSYDTLSETFEVIETFNLEDIKPGGFLTLGPDNKIYGTFLKGASANNGGGLFSYDPVTNVFETVCKLGTNNEILYRPQDLEFIGPGKIAVLFKNGGKMGGGGYKVFDMATNTYTDSLFFGERGTELISGVTSLTMHSNGWLYGMQSENLRYSKPAVVRVDPVSKYAEFMESSFVGPSFAPQNYRKLLEDDNGGLAMAGTNFIASIPIDNNTFATPVILYNDPEVFYDHEASPQMVKQGNRYFITGLYSPRYYDGTDHVVLHYPDLTTSDFTSVTKSGGEVFFTANINGGLMYGNLAKYDSVANELVNIFDFDYWAGHGAFPRIIRSLNDSTLVGITDIGGMQDAGLIFTFNHHTNTLTVEHELDSLIDGRIIGNEMLVRGNEIVFFTKRAGPNNTGALVRYNLDTDTKQSFAFKKVSNRLHTPNVNCKPLVNGNNLYLPCDHGGTNNAGGVIKYNIATGHASDFFENKYPIIDESAAITALGDKIYMRLNNYELLYNTTQIVAADTATGTPVTVYTAPSPYYAEIFNMTAVGDKILGTAYISGSSGIMKFDPVTHALTLTVNIGSGSFIGDSPMQQVNDSLCIFARPLCSATQTGEFYIYNFITEALTDTVIIPQPMPTCKHTARTIPTVSGNSVFGMVPLSDLGPSSALNGIIYKYNYVDQQLETQFIDPFNGDHQIGDVHALGDKVSMLMTTDSLETQLWFHEIDMSTGTHSKYHSGLPRRFSYYQRCFKTDTLGFYNIDDLTAADDSSYIYRYNFATHTGEIYARYRLPESGYNYKYTYVNDTLYGTSGSEINYWNETLQHFVEIDSLLTGEYFSDLTSDSTHLYVSVTGSGYDKLIQYDISTGFTKTILYDLGTDIATHHCIQVKDLVKKGDSITGVAFLDFDFPNAVGVFNYNLSTGNFTCDPYYTSMNLHHAMDMYNDKPFYFDGDRLVYGSPSSSFHFVTHDINAQEKDFIDSSEPIVHLNLRQIIPYNAPYVQQLSIDTILASTCLNAKIAFAANTYGETGVINWFVNGRHIANGNNDTLIIPHLYPELSGWYSYTLTQGATVYKSDSIEIDFDYCREVYPGDANSDSLVNGLDILQIGLGFGTSGIPRSTVSNTFVPYECNEWLNVAPNYINLKHADCNGDGTIDYADTVAVSLNSGLNHTLRIEAMENPYPVMESRSLPLPVKLQANDTVLEFNEPAWCDLVLGDAANAAEQFYGISAVLHYNEAVVNELTLALDLQPGLLYGNPAQVVSFWKQDMTSNTVEVAISRRFLSDTTGHGSVIRIGFNAGSTVTNAEAFRIESITAIQSTAFSFPLEIDPAEHIQVIEADTSTGSGINEIPAVLCNTYPNPVNDLLQVSCDTSVDEITVYTVQGKIIPGIGIKQNLHGFTANVSALSPGMYLVAIRKGQHTYYNRMIKQ